jgi:small neutral amino acid transporter SnatA (MarC family)
MLIYGAFNEPARRLVLMVAGASKIVFISLVLIFGQQFLQFQVGTSILVDGIIVLLFAAFLVATRKQAAA